MWPIARPDKDSSTRIAQRHVLDLYNSNAILSSHIGPGGALRQLFLDAAANALGARPPNAHALLSYTAVGWSLPMNLRQLWEDDNVAVTYTALSNC